NQAVAASRIGADVTMIGSVGQDDFGKSLLSHFQTEGIHHKGIHISPHVSTGIATIILSENDNRIIVAPGANARVTPEMIHNSRDVLLASDIILLQFEIPMETIQFTIDLAYKHQIPVIVNPAPFQEIPEDIFKKVTYFRSENDNRIIVAPGANARVTPEMIHNSRDVLLASDIILLQFEIPMETIQFTIDLAYKHQIPVIVNPAPFQEIPEDIFKKVTYF